MAESDNTVIVEPIVKESDFPEKSPRLKELIAEFQARNPMQVPETQVSNLAVLQQTASAPVTQRKFNELSKPDKDRVCQIAAGIDYLDLAALQTFGDTQNSVLTQNADAIISKHSTKSIGDIGNPLAKVVAAIKTNDLHRVVGRIQNSHISDKPSVLRKLVKDFSGFKKVIEESIAKHQTISQNLQAVQVQLENQKSGLSEDIIAYQQMFSSTFDQVSDYEMHIIALDLMIEEATDRFNELKAKPSHNIQESKELFQLSTAIDRMKAKKTSIMSVQTITYQSIPQLIALLRGDAIIADKINEVIILVIPLWKQQFAMAVGLMDQKQALQMLDATKAVTSQLIKDNAALVHDNLIDAQAKLYETAVAVEDLTVVQDYINDMVSAVKTISSKASARSDEEMRTMRNLQAQNVQLIQG